jgi:hypothetical protein
MSNLSGANIGLNFKGLLNLGSTINTPLSTTLQAVTDGDGVASHLFLSTTEVAVRGTTNAQRLIIDANAGVGKLLSFRSGNLQRWAIRVDGTESGANAGADIAIRRYDDAGTFIDAPITLTRSTGFITLGKIVSYTGSTGTSLLNFPDAGTTAADGISFGTGNSNLYRSGANSLRTDGSLRVQGQLLANSIISNSITGIVAIDCAVSLTPSTLTGSSATSALSIAQTWNTTGNPTAIFANITTTASGANAKLIDLQVGGTSMFNIHKTGVINGSSINFTSSIYGGMYFANNIGKGVFYENNFSNSTIYSNYQSHIFKVGSTGVYTKRSELDDFSFSLTPNSLTGSGSSSALSIAQTWNTTGAPTVIDINVTNTASAFSSDFARFRLNGTNVFQFRKDGALLFSGITINQNGAYLPSSGILTFGAKSILTSPSDGIFMVTNQSQTDFSRLQLGGITNLFPAIKRSTTRLQLRLADDSDFTGLDLANANFGTTTGTGRVNLPDAGTTAADGIQFGTGLSLFKDFDGHLVCSGVFKVPTSGTIQVKSGADARFTVDGAKLNLTPLTLTGSSSTSALSISQTWNTTGNPTAILLNVTNTASAGTSRLIDLIVGGNSRFSVDNAGRLIAGNSISAQSGSTIGWSSSTFMQAPSDGVFRLSNNGGTGFDRIQFGGTTSSFPSIKRSTTILQARLADDSGFTFIEDLYRRSGSGSPEGVVTAPMGAIYHNTLGGANVSIYVKESGTGNTGWVAK